MKMSSNQIRSSEIYVNQKLHNNNSTSLQKPLCILCKAKFSFRIDVGFQFCGSKFYTIRPVSVLIGGQLVDLFNMLNCFFYLHCFYVDFWATKRESGL